MLTPAGNSSNLGSDLIKAAFLSTFESIPPLLMMVPIVHLGMVNMFPLTTVCSVYEKLDS